MPYVYNAAMAKGAREPRTFAGNDGEDKNAWILTLAQTIGDVGKGVLMYKNQKAILALQLERAKKGLDPLPHQYLESKISLSVNPDLDDEGVSQMTKIAADSVGENIKKYSLPIGIGILGIVIFSKRFK